MLDAFTHKSIADAIGIIHILRNNGIESPATQIEYLERYLSSSQPSPTKAAEAKRYTLTGAKCHACGGDMVRYTCAYRRVECLECGNNPDRPKKHKFGRQS